MPELIEVEQYRRALDPLIGARIEAVVLHHPSFVRPHGTPPDAFRLLEGGVLQATRRRGKLLLVDVATAPTSRPRRCDADATLGIRFGMTGMLFVDGVGPIDQLEYASARTDPAWNRAEIRVGGASVTIRDQRRLGSLELDPDESQLGPDAATVTDEGVAAALAGRRRAVKAVLLDQHRLAGIGNLLADEALWRCGLDPQRRADELSPDEVGELATAIRDTVAVLGERGGSHTGDSFAHRTPGATCPRCGGPMVHDTVGGRSTWWCSAHQR